MSDEVGGVFTFLMIARLSCHTQAIAPQLPKGCLLSVVTANRGQPLVQQSIDFSERYVRCEQAA